MLDPVGDAAGIVADILVALFAEQADRLRAERSGEVPAIDRDFPRQVGQDFPSPSGNVSDR